MRSVYIALLAIIISVLFILWVYPQNDSSFNEEKSKTDPEGLQNDREKKRKSFFSHSDKRNKRNGEEYYKRLAELKLALMTNIREQSERERMENSAIGDRDMRNQDINKEHNGEGNISDERQKTPENPGEVPDMADMKEEARKRKELLVDLESRYQDEGESIDSTGSENIKNDLLEAMNDLEIPVDMFKDVVCQYTSCKVEFVLEDIQKGGPLMQLVDEAPGEYIYDIAQNDEGQTIVKTYFAREGFDLKGETVEE